MFSQRSYVFVGDMLGPFYPHDFTLASHVFLYFVAVVVFFFPETLYYTMYVVNQILPYI